MKRSIQSISCRGVLILLIAWSWHITAQPDGRSYYGVAAKSYGIEDGLPYPCIESTFTDDAGRLYVIACSHVQEAQDLHVYQFDGHNAYRKSPGTRDQYARKALFATDRQPDGTILGFARFSKDLGDQFQTSIFFYDPQTGEFSFEDPSFILKDVRYSEDKIYSLSLSDSTYEIHEVSGDHTGRLAEWSADQSEYYIPHRLPLFVTEDEFLVITHGLELIRIDRTTRQITHIPIPLPKSEMLSRQMRIVKTPSNELLLGLPKYGWLFKVHMMSGEVSRYYPPDQIDIRNSDEHYVFTDDRNQILFATIRDNHFYQGILIDQQGGVHDYTNVLRTLPQPLPIGLRRHELASFDFTKQLFYTGLDFVAVEVSSKEGIDALPTTQPVRGITEISKHTLYLSKDRIVDISGEVQLLQQQPPECLIPAHRGADLLKDPSGIIWTSDSRDKLIRYDPRFNTCRWLKINLQVRRFIIDPIGDAIATTIDNDLIRIDTSSGRVTPLLREKLPGFINQIFRDRESRYWIASSAGLLLLNLADSSWTNIYSGLGPSDTQILCIYQDTAGMLWLGTFSKGLHILNPSNGQVRIVNKNQGLSDNTVPVILEDEQQTVWAGTFHGITILDQNGGILGHAYDADGLVDNECNRWSAYRTQDGLLCFGTPVGLSVIRPEKFKQLIADRPPTRIYLTKVTHGDSIQLNTSAGPADRLNESIKLPARDRNLKISYALSSYATPDDNQYAYLIEGVDKSWNYIGGVRDLALVNLPAGRYNILIKGADYRGQWTSNQLVVPVIVRKYFYQNWWFYALCAVPFVLIGAIWIYRQGLERRRLENEVRKRTATIRKQTDELRELDRAKSKLYTNITHEFRTPLTVIRGLADQAGTDPQAAELIKRNTDNILDLVNQMLDLRKLESGHLAYQPVQGDIMRFLRYLAESYRSIAGSKQQQFHFLSEHDELIMDFDPDKLTRVVSNLLSNAIKFTPAGGDIYLQVDHADDQDEQVTIKVIDTGIGIPADKLERIFERFYQVDDSSTRRGEGTGIGLTLASEMVALMGGNIQVTSKQGHGSTFTVALPVIRDAPLEESGNYQHRDIIAPLARHTIEDPEGMGVEMRDHLPELLVVEDNPDVIHYLTTCLDDSYQLRIAMDGQEGIEKAIEHVPDLIISDVMMPEKNGFELCETLKDNTITNHIPIILLTARADAESRLKGLSRGADAYLEKPFDKQELLVRIEKLLELRSTLQNRYGKMEIPVPSDDPDLQVDDAFITRFREILLANLENPDFGIAEMCDTMHIGRTQLHNKITALTGKSTSLFVRQIRLHESKKLLKDPSNNISEVAYAVGFKDPKYFTRVFKQEFGIIPSEWS